MIDNCCGSPNYQVDGDHTICRNCGNIREFSPPTHNLVGGEFTPVIRDLPPLTELKHSTVRTE